MAGIRTEPVTVNLGPQHPSTHGVFRLRVTFDGEEIIDSEPIFGYLHRGTEKLAESRNYVQIVTLTDRLDYVSSMSNNLAYVSAVEKLADIQVPERAQYIRVISAELQRIASHLMATGFLLNDLGALATPLTYCFRERERILDLFEMLCGARVTLSYMRPGGIFQDAPEEFWSALNTLILDFPHYLDELESLITSNEIVLSRTLGVGKLTDAQAIDCGVSGPNLRASSVKWDLRKADPYEIYDRVKFDVPIGVNGDVFDRYYVRALEMRESIKIISQCIDQIEDGPIRTDAPYFIRPPKGEIYSAIEAPKGELGFYLVSDGSIAPYRCKVRAPSYLNLTPLSDMLKGWKMGDLIIILGSIDFVLGEVDR
ncbi:MAG: NADH-quinone oxidoreductase subunit NuoD [Dehalococcoidia bacterium]|nr:NADH-quinone oxidoreductase subunit NuoD [Dehalococcoidia bacterium]|tara:strand:- start:1971 stop:3077 length:1107 start_codon:yes stop_codon:yes gene_type:complete